MGISPFGSWRFLLGVLLVSVAGCGPSGAIVNGKVTYKGNPLTSGEVRIIPFLESSGPSRSSLISPQGTFEIHDAPIGQVTVTVASYKTRDAPKGPIAARKKTGEEVEEVSPRTTAIPAKY